MDLCYYGSQDVPLPLEGGRGIPSRLRRSGARAFCEACSSPVDPVDLKRGRASEIFGLILCETCRMKARAEERIELYFCDRCQVSVPVCRVDTGEALAGDGRILCLDCRRTGDGPRLLLRLLIPLCLVAGIVLSSLLLPEVVGRPELVRAREPDLALLLRSALGRELAAAFADDRSGELNGRIARFSGMLKEVSAARDLALQELEDNYSSLMRLKGRFEERMQLLEVEAAQLHQKLDVLLRDPPRLADQN